MNGKDILYKVDHTLLTVDCTWEQIKNICDEAIIYKTASVCIPPAYVKRASEYVCGRIKVCTVIGFPNGYSTTEVKVFEARDAIKNGADELDMVINVGELKSGNLAFVENEIHEIKHICGDKILKVIIETCLLTNEEKKLMCEIVTRAGADYIKTSTGFSKGGATFEDVRLMSENIGKNIKIKAAGGISSVADAEKFIELGCSRLGTSRLVKLIGKAE